MTYYRENWFKAYRLLVEYKDEFGNVDVPFSYVAPNGMKLGRWLHTQKNRYLSGMLTDEYKKLLEDLGVNFYKDNTRALEKYKKIKQVLEVFGPNKLNKSQKDFLLTQKRAYKAGKLTTSEAELLLMVLDAIDKDKDYIMPITKPNVHIKPKKIPDQHVKINLRNNMK